MHVVVAGGRVVSCHVRPRALALPPEELAGHVPAAVNEALDDDQAGRSPVIDPLALAGQFREIRDDVAARADDITAAIQASASRLRQEAEVPFEVPALDLGPAFDRLAETLEAIGRATAAERATAEATGEGAAAGGLVHAVCRPVGRVASVTIRPRAMRDSARLGEALTTAVNRALDDLEAGVRKRRQAAGADPEQISARLADLRDLGVEDLRAFGRAMNDFMGGIKAGPRPNR